MKTIGIITIGQSPRQDVVEEMKPFFGEDINVLERGVLDGLSLEQAKMYYPEKGMTPLCTRMKNGTEIVIAEEKILSRMQILIDDLNHSQVSLILLLCVCSFPTFKSSCLIIQPGRIVYKCVEGLITSGCHLGIIVPIPEQKDWVQKIFGGVASRITVVDASPYGSRDRLHNASQLLEEANCDLIVMYCMGFNRKLVKVVRSVTGKPVILSSSIAARTMGELLE